MTARSSEFVLLMTQHPLTVATPDLLSSARQSLVPQHNSFSHSAPLPCATVDLFTASFHYRGILTSNLSSGRRHNVLRRFSGNEVTHAGRLLGVGSLAASERQRKSR